MIFDQARRFSFIRSVCGGHLRVLGCIADLSTAGRFLGALGRPTEPPPLARDPDDAPESFH